MSALDVTQADREAAAREREQAYSARGINLLTLETPTEIRRGERDFDPLVKKHAAHRLAALTQQGETTPVSGDEVERRFWLIVHEPGMVPERKGSWPATDTAKVLREFIAARPSAYLHVLTVGADGVPDIDHGPQVLQMLDGRSMSVGRKHNARTLAAHSAALHPTDQEAIRREALEEAARVAEEHQPLGYMSERERSYCREHGEEIAAAIRALMSAPEKEVG